MEHRQIPEWRLWARAFLPSGASLAGSFVFVVVVAGLHLFFVSNDSNVFVSKLTGRQADPQLVGVYSSAVQKPVDRVFGSNGLGVLSTALIWGLVGWLVYSILDYVLITAKEFRADSSQVVVPDADRVVKHPLHRQLVVRLLWRFMIGLVLIAATSAMRPWMYQLIRNDILLLNSDSVLEMVKIAAITFAGWFAIIHVYVVLFRLFVLRTRLFGEIIY